MKKPKPLGASANRNITIRNIRRGVSAAVEKYTIGGQAKKVGGPRPITLPTTPWRDPDLRPSAGSAGSAETTDID